MTDTAAYADVMLPATTFLEHYDIAKGYGAYHLQLVQPVIAPVGESRPNHDVFDELSVRLGQTDAVTDLGDTAGLLDAAARMPDAHASAVLDQRRPQAPGGGAPVQFVDVHPKTGDGRVHLFPAGHRRARRPVHLRAGPGDGALSAEPDLPGQHAHHLVDLGRTAPGGRAHQDASG